jgi:hypothetical protein
MYFWIGIKQRNDGITAETNVASSPGARLIILATIVITTQPVASPLAEEFGLFN